MYELENESPTLSGFLEEIALVTDIDAMGNDDKVLLMTIHAAKGLEFNNVFISGMEEGIFPGTQSIYDGDAAIEEERRLAYVAITRAKRELTITNTSTRLLFGSTNRNVPSRFLREIPGEYCNIEKSATQFSSFLDDSFARKSSAVNHIAAMQRKQAFKDTNKYFSGMSVEHKTFGEGVVLSVNVLGDDSLLEIEFKQVGKKKLMANFAKLKII